MKARLALVSCVVLATASWSLASGTPAGAAPAAPGARAADDDTATVLPFHSFAAMTTDHVKDLAYLSGSTSGGGGRVAVVDGSGAVVHTYANLSSPTGLTLSGDGSTLYVAAVADEVQAIVSIDLASGARRTYDLGEDRACDTVLAVVDDQVWFDLCRDDQGQGGLGVLDPASGEVHRSSAVADVVEQLASDPGLPHRLVVGTGNDLLSLEVTEDPDDSGGPVVAVSATRTEVDTQTDSLTLSPGGETVLVGGAVYRTTDLASIDAYPADDPVTSAQAPDGTVAVGNGDDTGHRTDLYVYRPGHTVFAEQTDYGPQLSHEPVFVAQGGLGFGATSLFAVTWSGPRQDGDDPVVHVTRPDPLPDPIGSRRMSVPRVDQLVSDPAHAQEFVSTGPRSNGLIVLDDQRRITHVLQHLPGISQITRSGNTLWMSLAGGDALAAMDTRTYAVRTYPLGTDSAPESVAVAAGEVWFSHAGHASDDAFGPDSLGALDPLTGQLRPRVASFHAHDLQASALHPHSIYGVGDHLPAGFPDFVSPPEVRVRVSGGPSPSATVVAARDVGYDAGESVQTSDRLHVAYTGPHSPWHALDSQDLGYAGRASDQSDGGVAAAVRSDGLVARAYDDGSVPDVTMRFGALGPTWRRFSFPADSVVSGVVEHGLAFGPSDLLGLVHDSSGDGPETAYRVVEIAAPDRQRLSLATDQDSYSSGDTVRLVAHVEPRLLPQHPRISIQARPNGGSTRPVTSDARPDAWGNVTVTTRFGRPLTFTAQVLYGKQRATARLCRDRPLTATTCS